jgi:hypothetical protein
MTTAAMPAMVIHWTFGEVTPAETLFAYSMLSTCYEDRPVGRAASHHDQRGEK